MFKAINLRKLITSLAIPLGTGLLAAFLTKDSMDIYQRVQSPPLSPPGILFPIVWTILYTLMGISLYIVREEKSSRELKQKAYLIFGLQLIFNFLWSIVFFNLSAYTFAAVWLVALIALIVLNIIYFFRINKTAGLLLIPYLLWCIFALYLNIGIAILN